MNSNENKLFKKLVMKSYGKYGMIRYLSSNKSFTPKFALIKHRRNK